MGYWSNSYWDQNYWGSYWFSNSAASPAAESLTLTSYSVDVSVDLVVTSTAGSLTLTPYSLQSGEQGYWSGDYWNSGYWVLGYWTASSDDVVVAASLPSLPLTGYNAVVDVGGYIEADVNWAIQPLATFGFTESDALLADDVESSSELTSPTLSENVDALTAEDVESQSELTSPTLSENVDALTAGDIEAVSELSLPNLFDGTVQPTKSGGGRVKKKRRYVVEIDGQFFDADNAPQVEEVLEKAVALAESAQILSKPKINIKTVRGRAVRAAAVTQALSNARESMDEVISRNREKARIRDEEDAITALLM